MFYINLPEAALLLTWSSDDPPYDLRVGLILCFRLGLILGLLWLVVLFTTTVLPLFVGLRLFLKKHIWKKNMHWLYSYNPNMVVSNIILVIQAHTPKCLWIDFGFFFIDIWLIWRDWGIISNVWAGIMTRNSCPIPHAHSTTTRDHIVGWGSWVRFVWWWMTRWIWWTMFSVFTGWVLSNGSTVQVTMAWATPSNFRCSWSNGGSRRSYSA